MARPHPELGTGAFVSASVLILLAASSGPPPCTALPIVDPGLFVILGVKTCGAGAGYCLLGTDCTLDRDFAADTAGHCEGLRAAFTPAAHFSCCKYVERSNATLPGEPADATTTEDPGAVATTLTDDAENVIETEITVKPGLDEVANDAVEDTAKDAVKDTVDDEKPPSPAPAAAPQAPLTLASGQTVVAVSEDYKVKDSPDEEEEAEVVAVAQADKEAVLEATACRSPGQDVNPCWRSSFLDRQGATLCSGTLVGVDAALTSALCANRIMEAGTSAVSLRVDGLSLPVRDIAVHQDYRAIPDDPNDIAVVRVLLAGATGVLGAPSPSCIACLPPAGIGPDQLDGKACFALAARLNGLGVETSAVCSGRVAVKAGNQGLNLKLSGCEVATLKTAMETAESQQVLAVKAREGAALLCDGALVGLASTPSGSYIALTRHLDWLSRALAAPRTTTFQT